MSYGRDFDFNKTFFEQFEELLTEFPWPSLRVERSENCEYNNDMSDCKNCYLCARTHMSSDMLYCYRGNKSSDSMDCYQVHNNSQYCYECVECGSCYNSRYLYFCSKCMDSYFLRDCHDCQNCFMCTNQRKKQYMWKNEQLTKEEYEKHLGEIDFSSHAVVQQLIGEFASMQKDAVKRNSTVKSGDLWGDNIINTSNCYFCFAVKNVQDCRYAFNVKNYSSSMDLYSGGRNSELVYYATSTTGSYNCKFCVRAFNSTNVTYGMFIHASKNIFGCIGIRNGEYCILNKKYSKEEYEDLIPRIIAKMTEDGAWGEFFPARFSPFGYNQTVAHEYMPLEKETALQQGFNWSDFEQPMPQVEKVIDDPSQLPDRVDDIPDDVLQWAIRCEKTGKPYRIVPQEMKFYRDHKIPLPRLCPDERHLARFSYINPLQLRASQCAKCGTDMMETSYPQGTENIWCNDCYTKEFL